MHDWMECQQTGVLQLPTMARCKPQKWRLHVPAIAWLVLGITGSLLKWLSLRLANLRALTVILRQMSAEAERN
jgi:hypothetical protein